MPLLDTIFLGNPVLRWLIALLIAASVLATVSLGRWLIRRRSKLLTLRTNTFLDEVGAVLTYNTSGIIAVLLAFYLGSLVLSFDLGVKLVLRSAAVILLLVQVGIWGRALIARYVERYEERNRATNAAGVGTTRIVSVVVRFVFYALITLLILDNVPGVEITPLLASLGIGGIAVALAVQNILTDLFASLSIALDKPFVLGDFIVVGDELGTVEQIGLKTTRVRSLSGEQLIFANSDLLSSRVRNFQRMEERRVVFNFRVAYDTPPEQVRAIPELVRGFVEDQEQVRFDRASLLRFDDIGLYYEVVYFVLTPDFNRFIAVQHAINLAIVERFAADDIGFASLTEGAVAEARGRRTQE